MDDDGGSSSTLLVENQSLRDRVAELEAAQDLQHQEMLIHTSLHEATLALMQRLDLDDLLQAILHRSAALADAEHGFISLLETGADMMRMKAGLGLFNEATKKYARPGRGIVGKVWATGEPFIVYDYDNWEDRLQNIAPGTFYSIAALPLRSGDTVNGVMALAHQDPHKEFSPAIMQRLDGFASLASIALYNALLYQQLEESQQFVNRLLNAAPVLLYVYDVIDNSGFYINDGFVTLLGYSAAEAAEISMDPSCPEFIELFHPDDLERLALLTIEFQRGNAQTLIDAEFRLKHRDGTYRWIEARNTVFALDRDGRVKQIVGVGIDITARKQVESHSMALLLEQERMRLLSGFIRDASHSFRTPLSTINTSAYLLQRITDPDRHKHHTQKIQQQVMHLNRLIEVMLQMTQLDQGASLDFELTDINLLLTDTCSELRQAIIDQQLQLALNLGDLPPYRLDQHEMTLALKAIIENAVLFTLPGGTITVTTSAGEDISIAVADTGVGISAADLPHIFEHFFRGGKAHDVGGLGMGLSIACKVVRRHQGIIEVESEPDKGSCFTVRLPLGDSTSPLQRSASRDDEPDAPHC